LVVLQLADARGLALSEVMSMIIECSRSWRASDCKSKQL
jgi:hypothetical protein